MANSARDPVFWAGVAVAEADNPEETQVCVRCHAPRAFLNGNESVTRIEDLEPSEISGIECELCHRMTSDPETPPGNARYTIDDELGPGGSNVPRRGPWDYTDGVPEPPHDWVFDPYLSSSRHCGTCHDVTTPRERVDDDGVPMGRNFNEQRTYSEWVNSAYADDGPHFASCQDCHMTAVADKPGCSDHVNLFAHAEGGSRHDFNGANRFMLEVLKREYGSEGTNEIPDRVFDDNIAHLEAFIQTAATLDVESPEVVDVRQPYDGLTVRVTNHTGHKLPSGYSEGRRMWIEVRGGYAGDVFYSSGAWTPETGIEEDPQLRDYEAVAEDYWDGQQFRLLRNNHWVVDNRIPPLGLVPNIETDPVGDRYAQLEDGTWPNFDTAHYAFAAVPRVTDVTPDDPDDDRLRLTVRLRYLINTPEYVSFLEANGAEAGAHVADLFDEMGGAVPTTLAERTLSIRLVGLQREGSSATTGGAVTGNPPETGGSTNTAGPDPSSDATTGGSSAGSESRADAQGCGCTAGAPSAGGTVLGLVPLLALRRRRRRSSVGTSPP